MKTLALVKEGKVNTAFRKWTRPSVKEGGTLNTVIGVLRIDGIESIEESQIGEKELLAAGYQDRESFYQEVLNCNAGHLFKIRFHLEGEDPRIALRNSVDFLQGEISEIRERLSRFDKRSKIGPWTGDVLQLIAANPGKRAQDFADQLEVEKGWLKTNIRKLKNLGLAISLETGYKISPRGQVYINNE